MSQKKPQKYQNRVAFKVQFNPKHEQVTSNAPFDRLCQRCFDQIKWKIQYGKYKPRANVSRCNKCDEKSITKAYRTLCDKCADKDHLCTKCGKSKDIVADPGDEPVLDKNGVDKNKLHQMEEYMKSLRERSRRKILRLIKKGEIDWNGEHFINIESNEPVEGVRFKGDVENMEDNWDDDDDEDGDFDDDDDEDALGDDDDDDDSDEDDKKKKAKKGGAKENKAKEVKVVKEEKKADAEVKITNEPEEITEIVKEKVLEKPKEEKNANNNKKQKGQEKNKKKKKKQESSDDDDLDDFSDSDFK